MSQRKDETSVFGAKPERLDRLVFEALEDSGAEEATPTASLGAVLERPGGQIGRYRLLSVLGEGGMGIVYLAEQERPIKRRVALKVIKPGMDSKRVIARFEAERQALALLDHANIAQVHDAGTTDSGRPYFVMEYVQGLPITEYCDRHTLSIEERLILFRHVCDAVQHAHQKGIIHRDIKPSNILVSGGRDKAVPKIIDFGVAKAIAQPLSERTLFTEETQLLGTPEYMSPEQADMASEDIDTRSDIYSLGVLLYVLLTGALPFDSDTLRAGGIEQIRKTIRETDPKTPSTRLTKLGEEAKEVAEKRCTQVASLAKRLRRELEWIPLKAMRKERIERYRSASELADDIENYIKGDPLIAGPLTTVYRFKKFLRRNRALVTAIAVVVGVLIAGVVVSTIFALEAHQQKQTAETRELSSRRNLYFARIGLARQAWENGNVAEMLGLLNSLRPESKQEDLRHFEWYYLWRLANAHHQTLYGHTRYAVSIAFSPLGDVLASASYDKTIKLWNPASGQFKETLHHTDQVRSLAFSPDGKTLASGCRDGTLRLWDMRTGQATVTISGDYSIATVAFSPDGETLAAGLFDGRVMLWELAGCELETPLTIDQLPPSEQAGIAFSPDGRTLAIGGGEYNQPCDVILWDRETQRIRATLKGHTSQIRDIEFSPDGRQLATASHDRTVRLWDPYTAQTLAVGKGHNASLWDVTFSPDSRHLATASSDLTIILWDKRLKELYHLKGHTGTVKCLSFSSDGKRLASGSNDRTVKLWDVETYEKGVNRILHNAAVYCLAFSPHDEIFVTGSESGHAVLWDSATEQPIAELTGHSGPIWSVGISNDGKIVATGSGDRTVKLWDIRNGNLLDTLPVFPDEVYSIAFSPDDEFLAVGCRDRSVILWNISKKKKEIVTGQKRGLEYLNFRPVSAIAFSPEGRLLATGGHYSESALPVLWDVTTKDQQIRLQGHTFAAWSVAFSHNGKTLATSSEDKTIKLWDRATGHVIDTLSGHAGPVLSVVFSPDDRILASGSDDRTVRIWDVRLGEQRAALNGHNGPVTSVAFSSDGNILATGSTDQSVIFWRATTQTEADEHQDVAESLVDKAIQSQ